MTYDLQIEIYPEYIYFQRTGTADKSEILESWTKAIEVCLEQGIKNLLVDTANEATLYAKEVFEMAVSLPKMGADSSFRIAHVFSGTEPESLGGRFAETVTRKRGFNYRKFDDVESAKEWLLIG